jgi:hypothetical protein
MSYSLEGYVDVAQRIRQLRAKHPDAVLRPADPANPFRIVDIGGREFIVYTAACYRSPDDPMPAIACAAEPVMGATNFTRNSEVMNAETSAWGRAIMAALAVDEPHIASADEVRNRRADVSPDHPSVPRAKAAPKPAAADSIDTLTPQEIAEAFGAEIVSVPQPQREQVRTLAAIASQKQVGLLKKLAKEQSLDIERFASEHTGRQIDSLSAVTTKEASAMIKVLMGS